MKKSIVILAALLPLAACQVEEMGQEFRSDSRVFYANTESVADTKTSIDSQFDIIWSEGDEFSIFSGSTVNERWKTTTYGTSSVTLEKVASPTGVTGSEIGNNVAVYPYGSDVSIEQNGSGYTVKNARIPAAQTYQPGSYSNGAAPMVAVTSSTSDNSLKFKNAFGVLNIKLTGTATIKQLALSGNNGETICGTMDITAGNDILPSMSMTGSGKTITLDCGEGVILDEENPTSFYFVLPPVELTQGFTVVIADTEGKTMKVETTKARTIGRNYILNMAAKQYEGVAENDPLTFTSEGETEIYLGNHGSPDAVNLVYRVNNGAWADYTFWTSIALSDGDRLSFKAGEGGNATFSKDSKNYYRFVMSGTGTVGASGNIMSLLDPDAESTACSAYCFSNLFSSCTRLTSAPELPATELGAYCYNNMFYYCPNLTSAPVLPATTLAEGCYASMFNQCSKLEDSPALPATSAASYCYNKMFLGCTNLKSAPVLKATTMAEYCYANMFDGCKCLESAPELPATSLAERCYSGMFTSCTKLTSAPELKATTMAESCYAYMFYGCTGLTTAPELPATTLADYCYYGMFYDCSGLTSAPELKATTLAKGCYADMFCGCTKLANAPKLPATIMAVGCYDYMFSGCKELTAAPELAATTMAEACYEGMFNECAKLETAPALPATTLAKDCYSWMFAECISLKTAPALTAKIMADFCYDAMFCGCTSLELAPELPSTSMAVCCYTSMFEECTSLTKAPVLPAEILADSCYDYMFLGCSKLNYIKMLATDISTGDPLADWTEGVASTGTFVKNAAATWDVTGTSGIPEGWTVITE